MTTATRTPKLKLEGRSHPTTLAAQLRRLEAIATGTGVGAPRKATTAHPCCTCNYRRSYADQVCPCGTNVHRGEKRCPQH